MKKTGKMTRFLILIFCLSATWLFGQDVRITLRASKTEVAVGEQFTIELTANVKGNGDVVLPPEIQVLGRMSGNSSRYINGKQSYEVSQTLTVMATETGSFNIPAAVWRYGKNQTANSNTLKIKVKFGKDTSNGAQVGTPQEPNGKHFAIFSTTKKEVYVGEAFVITGKIYFDGHIVDANTYKAYEHNLMLHKTDLTGNLGGLNVAGEEYGGKIYEMILMFDELIVAQQAGNLNFDAFSLNVGFQKGFFGKGFRNIVSNALQIRVLPLPDGAPKGFEGAVGTFDIRTSNDIQGNLSAGDVFTYKVHIEGSGNIHMLKPISLALPKGLILYGEPKIDNQVLTTRKGAHGHLEYEFVIQVQEAGTYDFSPFEFAFFNPEKKSYERAAIPNLSFTSEGDGLQQATGENPETETHANTGSSWWQSVLLVLLVLILMAIGVVYFLRKNKKEEAPTKPNKPKVDARAIAIRALDNVPTNNISHTADALEKIILQYFKDLTQNDDLLLDNDWFVNSAKEFNMSSESAEAWSQHFASIQALKYAGFVGENAEELVMKTRELVG